MSSGQYIMCDIMMLKLRNNMLQERLVPSYFFISIVIGPLNSLVW